MPAAGLLLHRVALLWWPPVLQLQLQLLLLIPQPSSLASPRAEPPSATPDPVSGSAVFRSPGEAPLNHLLLDDSSGQLYVGAVNALFHLSPNLTLLSWGRTGPKLDSLDCLPPIDAASCPQARETDNTNQLLLVEGERGLIVCGTALQGICEKRGLGNVSQVLYRTEVPVENQYVAANDPQVATVGVVVEQPGEGGREGPLFLLVGRGYTSKGPGIIPPITVRRLEGTPLAPAFSHEELGKLVVGSYSEYNSRFVAALRHAGHVYFLLWRRNVRGRREYRTYVSRLCARDAGFYSYVEVPLSCGGPEFRRAQAASLLAARQDAPALFVVMADERSPPRTALCAFPLLELDRALQRAQHLCYTQEGFGPQGQREAYIEYGVKSDCLRLPQDSVQKYPCGGEHTPSPIASTQPLEVTPIIAMDTLLSAVTTTTESGHTIVLLGDSQGRLHKVLVQSGVGQVYETVQVDPGSAVSADLLLDGERENVYVMTRARVTKVPVSQCGRHTDCPSCLSASDPYCGWCVLEGRCCRKLECSRHQKPNHWLWSYDPQNRCVAVQSISPANQSRDEQTQVSLSVPLLPFLSEAESLSCTFGNLPAQPAVVTATSVTCLSPSPELLPPSAAGRDHVVVPVAVMFGDVTVAQTLLTLYDCGATGRLNVTSPCMACVSSVWGCHWCLQNHLCTHRESCPDQRIIYSSQLMANRLTSSLTPNATAVRTAPSSANPHSLSTPSPPSSSALTNQTPSVPPLPSQQQIRLQSAGATTDGNPASASEPANHTDGWTGSDWMELEEGAGPNSSSFSSLADDGTLPFDLWDSVPFNTQSSASDPRGPTSCPSVWGLESSPLVPVQFPTQLVLLGQNLDLFEGEDSGYQCVVEIEGTPQTLAASLEALDPTNHTQRVSCQTEQFQYSARQLEYHAPVYLQRVQSLRIDTRPDLHLRLYDCAVGQSDCSQCGAVSDQYGCVWCQGEMPSCLYNQSCPSGPVDTCPSPHITEIEPQTGPVEGGIALTIWGSNLGQSFEDIQAGVTVAGVSCVPQPQAYLISTRVVCELQPSEGETEGPVRVTVGDQDSDSGESEQTFTYQDPRLSGITPARGPMAGGTLLTVLGSKLRTGQRSDLAAYTGHAPCLMEGEVTDTQLVCRTSLTNETADVEVKVLFGRAERILGDLAFQYTEDPVITYAAPAESFYGGGRVIKAKGRNLDVVQRPIIMVQAEPAESGQGRQKRFSQSAARTEGGISNSSSVQQELCLVHSPEDMGCPTPPVPAELKVVGVWFQMDNVRVEFEEVGERPFTYHPDPELRPLNGDNPDQPFRFKPGGVLAVEGRGLTLAMTREEVIARVGQEECEIKTLDSTHLYCEPPESQPSPEDTSPLPALTVVMGRLQFPLGLVQYDSDSASPFPLAAQVGLAGGAAVVVLVVLVIILMYRRKSKQAMRDYKKVLVQLETLEINVGDQCRKEFTDLMTEMMDLSSDLGGPGIPFLDYRSYAERVFFPGQQGAPLARSLELPEARRATVEQGLSQLNNLLNNRAFLIKFIHTLESQQGFSQRDRGYVASLLTLALHDKLEYYTDVMKGLLGDLAEQYVAKNPKLMLRRTETVVEKMLTNWMSICLYSFLKEVAGEPLYMLYRAIKYQVDKGPVDAVTGKAKRTLNDSHLLREDIDYNAMTLTVLVKTGSEVHPTPVRVLDIDTITQVKDKILDQVYKGMPFSQRPHADSLDLEWRAGQAGHLTLSDDDVTAVVQGRWKRLNTLQHYKVPDGATVALVPRARSSVQQGVSQVFQTGEKTPMLEAEEEGGLRLWHLVKSSEEPEIPKHRKSSVRERERAKAIPEIFLTRLLSMKGTLQKFVDDVFLSILSTKRPVPIAVRFFFDFLDELAERHGIADAETVHIWKTNSLPLRFWVNILKNPQFVFDVQVTDSVDAVLSVIAQTFIDSCTTSEHKVGRDSPVNKLLYAREIPRYKQLVERYYSDIHSAVSGCYQEMNSMLTELSGSFASEVNSLVALHELYKYINKHYDQIILALEEDPSGQKMQLAYRLQQVAALVENKVTDL
ncbi:plexin-B3 [Lepisosteus oculatus]|uniref:plexin-B3 n=1 Tax=Lepisosteus oculatus TaxID=7918 RepID=UPI0035F50BCF